MQQTRKDADCFWSARRSAAPRYACDFILYMMNISIGFHPFEAAAAGVWASAKKCGRRHKIK